MPSMSRSPLAVVREAYATAQESLPKYSGPYSRHTFTQWQLFAMLTLRHFMGLDLRSTVQLLCDWSDLREAIELKSIPHYSTLCVAEQRLIKKGVSSPSSTPASDAPAIVA